MATARAGNRRFWQLSALRAHTKAPYKIDFHRKTLRALNRPKAARTVHVAVARPALRVAEGARDAGGRLVRCIHKQHVVDAAVVAWEK